MFKRLLLEDSATVFTVVAFIVAASIFFSFAWRAFRMKRSQCKELEQLPFNTPTPAVGSPLPATSVDRSAQAPTLQKEAKTFSDESR